MSGLTQRSNGKYEVGFFYYGKKRFFGSFDSRQEGELATVIAREKIKVVERRHGESTKPAEEQIMEDVLSARQAAREAVSKLIDRTKNSTGSHISSEWGNKNEETKKKRETPGTIHPW